MKIFIFLNALFVFIISCSKPADNNQVTQTEPNPEFKKKRLTRMITTQINSEKTFRIQEWRYDIKNRCTELLEQGLMPVNGKDSMLVTARYTFFYNNTQTEPFRILQDGNSEGISSDVYMKYTADGKKLQDSTIFTHPALGKLLRVGTYKYGNGEVLYHYRQSNISWTGSANGITGEKQDTVYLTNGNVKEYRIKLSINSDDVIRYSFSYDNKVNPFFHQNITSAFYQIGPHFNYRKWFALYSEYDNFSISGYSNNNITKIEDVRSYQNAQMFTYSYDKDNYPTEATISFANNTNTAKVRFEYNQ